MARNLGAVGAIPMTDRDRRPLPFRVLAGVLLSLALLMAACGDGGATAETADDDSDTDAEAVDVTDDEVIQLRFAHWFPPDNIHAQSHQWWADEIEARTDGRVQIEMFFSEGLCPTDEIVPCQRDGRADLGNWSSVWHPGEFVLTNLVTVPFITDQPEAPMRAFAELYETNDDFRAQYEAQGLHVLNFNPIDLPVLGAKEPMEDLEWFRGKRVRALGYFQDAIEDLGGNIVAIPPTEIYEGMERGLLDALFPYPLSAFVTQGFHEVSDYMYYLGTGLYTDLITTISLDAWEDLPPDVQEVFTEVSEEWYDTFLSDFLAPDSEEACTSILESGAIEDFGVLADDQAEEWRERSADGLLDAWRADAHAAIGEEAAEQYLDEYLALIEQWETESDYVPDVYLCAERFAERT
jgi:TRAP-type C4-dicarboxylate transport system substrate-binding protein